MVVAKENSTQVNISPSVAATGHGAGTTYTVTLDSGDVYQVKANSNDLTGSHVWAANGKDFAVFAGNVCTNYGGCTACDHLFEEMFPVSAWDTAYVTVPLKTRANDLIKVLSKTAGTQVFRKRSSNCYFKCRPVFSIQFIHQRLHQSYKPNSYGPIQYWRFM
jgi:hypothetical protein